MRLHKVLISGDRYFRTEYVRAVRRVIRQLEREHGRHLLIIAGGASGVDEIAREVATKEGVHVAEIKALWAKRGRSAGPQRNRVMLALEPDEVIGFHMNWNKSTGTADCCDEADRLGISVSRVRVTHNG